MTPTLSWSDLRKSVAGAAGFPVDLPQSRRRYTYNGSAAIHSALQDMELERGAKVLLPAYCCVAELGTAGTMFAAVAELTMHGG